MKIIKYNPPIMIVFLLIFLFPLTLNAGVFTKEVELSSDKLTQGFSVFYKVDFGVNFSQIDKVIFSFAFSSDDPLGDYDSWERLDISSEEFSRFSLIVYGIAPQISARAAYSSDEFPELCNAFLDGIVNGEMIVEGNPYGSVTITSFTITIFGEPILDVAVDIKPGACPNPIGFADNKGLMPFAIMGTTDFDITQIDPESIRITREGVDAEVVPIRWSYEDVATPFEGELCDCHRLKNDGNLDLSMKLYGKDLVEILRLKEVAGQTIPLTVTGKLKDEFGGTPIEGKDCVRVLKTVLLVK